jgi:hypothetical protein
LIFGMTCKILGRAHGRSRLPETPALEGNVLLSGAQQTSGSLQVNTLAQRLSVPEVYQRCAGRPSETRNIRSNNTASRISTSG